MRTVKKRAWTSLSSPNSAPTARCRRPALSFRAWRGISTSRFGAGPALNDIPFKLDGSSGPANGGLAQPRAAADLRATLRPRPLSRNGS